MWQRPLYHRGISLCQSHVVRFSGRVAQYGGTKTILGPWAIQLSLDLLGSYQISSFTVQVDNNDTYRLEYRDASNHWVTAWNIPAVCCFGLMKRTFALSSPITTDALRLTATSGDLLYSVSEFKASTTEHDDRPTGGSAIDLTPQTVVCQNVTPGKQ
jgi:hypothetical protein